MKWRLLIAVVLGTGSLTSFAQATEWRKYVIPGTGANVDIPVSIFTEDAGAPEGGIGRRSRGKPCASSHPTATAVYGSDG